MTRLRWRNLARALGANTAHVRCAAACIRAEGTRVVAVRLADDGYFVEVFETSGESGYILRNRPRLGRHPRGGRDAD